MDTLMGAETEKALPKISQLKQPQKHKDWDSTDIHGPLHSLEDAQDRPIQMEEDVWLRFMSHHLKAVRRLKQTKKYLSSTAADRLAGAERNCKILW